LNLRNWIELGIVAATLIIGLVLLTVYKKKVKKLEGFEGIVKEFGEDERLDGPDWQAEMRKELERRKGEKR